jgi:hypothetical protein
VAGGASARHPVQVAAVSKHKTPKTSPGVMSLRKALAMAEHNGLEIEKVNRTGEIRLRSHFSPKPVTVNNRRTDSTREVQKLIERHVEEQKRIEFGQG